MYAICYNRSVKLERFSGKVQRVVDEYVGSAGSAAIVRRDGVVLFCSSHDDSASGLAPTFDEVPLTTILDEPAVVNLPIARGWCSYAVALDAGHVLFVIAASAVAPGVIAARMKTAAQLLRRVLAAGEAPPAAPSGGSGAPAWATRTRRQA